MGTTWAYLDITALGRQEDWEDSPQGYPQTAPYQWWHRHDEYPALRSAQNGRVTERKSTSTASGASSGTHGSCNGSDAAARPDGGKPHGANDCRRGDAAPVCRSTR